MEIEAHWRTTFAQSTHLYSLYLQKLNDGACVA